MSDTKISEAVERLERAYVAGMDEEFRDDLRVVLDALSQPAELAQSPAGKDAAAAIAARQPVERYEIQTENGTLTCGVAVAAEWQKNEEYIARLESQLEAARQPVAQVRDRVPQEVVSAISAVAVIAHKESRHPVQKHIDTINAWLYAARPAQGIDLGSGVRAIADERQRQVDAEGYSAENDGDYKAGELANAALAYVQVAAMDLAAGGRSHVATRSPPACWPWPRLWWKPKDARRDLVRAGALIAAQIDLIDGQRDAVPGVVRG